MITPVDVTAGSTYRGKRYPRTPDRYVLRRSSMSVQYDSAAVGDGAHYPTVTMDKFIKWADHKIEEDADGNGE